MKEQNMPSVFSKCFPCHFACICIAFGKMSKWVQSSFLFVGICNEYSLPLELSPYRNQVERGRSLTYGGNMDSDLWWKYGLYPQPLSGLYSTDCSRFHIGFHLLKGAISTELKKLFIFFQRHCSSLQAHVAYWISSPLCFLWSQGINWF